MKIRYITAFCSLGTVVLSAQTPPANQAPAAAAPAQAVSQAPAGPAKVGILSLNNVILGTQEGKKAYDDLNTRFQPTKAKIDQEGQKLQDMEKSLQQGANTMTADAKENLNRQIATLQRDLQQDSDNAQQDFNNAQSDMVNTMLLKISPLIIQYAQQHGFTLILDISSSWPQNPVLYALPSTDVTKDIVTLYDQAHPLASKPAATGGGSHP